jgi:superfamily II DNA or RNA helicase
VFADGLLVVEQAVRLLRDELRQNWKAVVGDTPTDERDELFRQLNNGMLPGLFFSKVGEAATDFRNWRIRYVIIMCSAGGSETQFAQRAGRVSRTIADNCFAVDTTSPSSSSVPGASSASSFLRPSSISPQKAACVYDLYTYGTNEAAWATERIKYLEEEGYSFVQCTDRDIVMACEHSARNTVHDSDDDGAYGGGGGGNGSEKVYVMPTHERTRLLQRMLSKAHDARVERRVHQALMLHEKERRREQTERSNRIEHMKSTIMKSRATLHMKNDARRHKQAIESAQIALSERMRTSLGQASSLCLLPRKC